MKPGNIDIFIVNLSACFYDFLYAQKPGNKRKSGNARFSLKWGKEDSNSTNQMSDCGCSQVLSKAICNWPLTGSPCAT